MTLGARRLPGRLALWRQLNLTARGRRCPLAPPSPIASSHNARAFRAMEPTNEKSLRKDNLNTAATCAGD